MKLVYTKDISLPTGYKRVEYLQSSGTQYIVSPVKFYGDNYKIECKFDNTDTPLSTTPFGYQNTGSGIQIMVVGFNNSNSTGSIFWNGTSTAHENRAKLNVMTKGLNELVIEANNGTLTYTLNGASSVSYETYTSFESQTENMWIFGNNRQSISGSHQLVSMKFYYLRIYQNNVLLYDLIPVLDLNNTPAIYDKVNDVLYYNQGTGEFTYGNVIAPCKPRFIMTPALPTGYTRIEYLESTTTSASSGPYINTGINYFADFELTAKQRVSASMKACGNSGNFCLERANATTNAWRFRKGSSSDATKYYDVSAVVTDLHSLLWKNNTIYVDGNKITSFTKDNNTGNFCLFGTGSTGRYPLLIYGCKMWDPSSGELVRNYIPCLDDNNVPCMYDTITKTPYYNAGNSSFSYGDPISQYTTLREIYIEPTLPEGYTKLNYIESTGTQYINTGLYLSNNHSVMLDYQYTTAPASGERTGLFGTLTSQTTPTKNPRYGDLVSPSSNKQEYGYGINNLYYQTDIPDTNRHVINHNKNEVYVDGVLINRFNTNAFECTTPAYLCNFNYTNYVPPKAKYYRFKVWNGDALIRDFIPMLRTSDTTPGMYDLVNKVFYTNNGTGTFLYG